MITLVVAVHLHEYLHFGMTSQVKSPSHYVVVNVEQNGSTFDSHNIETNPEWKCSPLLLCMTIYIINPGKLHTRRFHIGRLYPAGGAWEWTTISSHISGKTILYKKCYNKGQLLLSCNTDTLIRICIITRLSATALR